MGAELKANIGSLVDALVQKDEEAYESEFVHLLARVQNLVTRKLKLEGTKTDTRDLLGELLFTRMRRAMHLFLRSDDQVESARAAEWVMGLLFSVTTLAEFAKAFDKALLRVNSGDKEFSFAGRTDFISVEEVMQMLSSGKHLGCLSLEKDDNRLDIYLKDGRIFFLDPHQLVRRVMPGDSMRHREIPEATVNQAEAMRGQSGRPAVLGLHDLGAVRTEELREVLRLFGKEVLFDFMRTTDAYAFYYKKLDTLPEFAIEHDLRLGVTSLLLEGSKQLDDWRQMLTVFPDPDAPIEPRSDMFARMGETALGVLEIKLLSQIDGDTTPRSLVSSLGLPLFDVYSLLLKLSHDGVIAAQAGDATVTSMTLSVEESMQEAFAALDANDDDAQRQSAIDRVFGDEDDATESAANVLDAVLGGEGKRGAPGGSSESVENDLLKILRRAQQE